jgi:hypothetical protein
MSKITYKYFDIEYYENYSRAITADGSSNDLMISSGIREVGVIYTRWVSHRLNKIVKIVCYE